MATQTSKERKRRNLAAFGESLWKFPSMKQFTEWHFGLPQETGTHIDVWPSTLRVANPSENRIRQFNSIKELIAYLDTNYEDTRKQAS